MAGEGYRRLVEFQDRGYADLYLERAPADSRPPSAPPIRAAAHGYALTRETARFLALWMAFDDIVRVADRKCQASRFARVRREVGAGDGDVVRIVDYFKPGVPEVAALLPGTPARWLSASDATASRAERTRSALRSRCAQMESLAFSRCAHWRR